MCGRFENWKGPFTTDCAPSLVLRLSRETRNNPCPSRGSVIARQAESVSTSMAARAAVPESRGGEENASQALHDGSPEFSSDFPLVRVISFSLYLLSLKSEGEGIQASRGPKERLSKHDAADCGVVRRCHWCAAIVRDALRRISSMEVTPFPSRKASQARLTGSCRNFVKKTSARNEICPVNAT